MYIVRCLRYCKSTIFQANHNAVFVVFPNARVVCDTAKVRFFKQITTNVKLSTSVGMLFAILQKYDFSSKSQRFPVRTNRTAGCLRYCKSTIFQANHNTQKPTLARICVVCDTAKVRFFKQITTQFFFKAPCFGCLRYCKSTIFQANHNPCTSSCVQNSVVCDTAKVRFFKQITTRKPPCRLCCLLFAILQKYDFSSKSQRH